VTDSTPSGTASDPGAGAGGPGSAPEIDASLAAIVSDVRSIWSDTAAQVRGVSELALLELALAADSLQRLLWAVLVLAGLALSTWLFLLGAVAAMMMEYGVSAPLALLAVAVVNILAAGALFAFIRSLTQDLQFRNLRRYLSEQTREQSSEQPQKAA
jgi:hypothetical protein